MTSLFASFDQVYETYKTSFPMISFPVHTERWQGLDVSKKPEAAMREVLDVSFRVPMRGFEDLDYWRQDIKPNLPWADRHFELERVSGDPINPGTTWREWPYAHSADKHRTEGEQFNHTYAERYWPRYANAPQSCGTCGTPNASCDADCMAAAYFSGRYGIRYRYADLNDLVDHIARNPLTRQAYLPVWFPEDGSHDDRKPCSLGYHFISRGDYMHVVYYIRSCDFVRHFRDDCYLTVRLLLWILDRLREKDDRWKEIKPGMYTMHITSLHMFINDFNQIFGEKK